MQVRVRMGFVLAAVAFAAACHDAGNLVGPEAGPLAGAGAVANVPAQAQEPFSRWDSPWWRMSDAELTQKVQEAGGQVFIGFKEPGARGGVDDQGRVLVSGATVASGKAQLRARGIEIEMEFEDMPMVVARIPAALVTALRATPHVDYVEPVTLGERLQQQTTWNVQRVEAPQAWALTNGRGQGQKVLIIDSGVSTSHPDLSPAVVQACDGSNGLDTYGHGTQVAGIVAAVDNTVGIIGVAPSVQLWSSKDGNSVPNAAYTACGVQFGRTNGTFAINISSSLTPTTALTDQIKAAYHQNGLIVVAAAGNNNGGAVTYPANMAEVIAVTATDINNVRGSFAAIGSALELSAPGVSVTTTCLGSNPYCPVSGTSFAAPHVAAAAAILKAHEPSWTNAQIRQRLKDHALYLGAWNHYGAGLLRIHTAATAPPPLQVSISGPNSWSTGSNLSWTASASGGNGTYSYQWSERIDHQDGWSCDYQTGWSPVATGNPYGRWVSSMEYDFRVQVVVTSGTQTASAEMKVWGPQQIICPM
jgi:subtilisin